MQRSHGSALKILLGTTFCYLFYYAGRQNFSFAIAGLQNSINISPTQVGIISGCMLLVYGLSQPYTGALADRYGARQIITLGALASVLLNFSFSFASNFSLFVLIWSLNGFAQACGFPPGSKLITANWPKENHGRALGIFLFASSFSSAITYVLCIKLLQYFDWRWLFRLPVLTLAIATAVFYLLTQKSAAAPKPTPSTQYFWRNTRLLLRNTNYLCCCFTIGFNNLARYGLLIWLPVYYSESAGQQSTHSIWISTALPVGMAFGTAYFGYICDLLSINRRQFLIFCSMLLSSLLLTLVVMMPYLPDGTSICLLFLAGFFLYGPQSPLFSYCPVLLSDKLTGQGIGLMNGFGYLFAAIGEVLLGLLVSLNHQQYSSIFLGVIMSCLLCALCSLFISLPKTSSLDFIPEKAK